MDDSRELKTLPLEVGGETIWFAYDQIRRYCGLPWRNGPPETWAWAYYDEVPTRDANVVDATDVLAAAALHPRLLAADLDGFAQHADLLSGWLSETPRQLHLADADDRMLEHLTTLARWEMFDLDLLTKVLHRKRPHLIPLHSPSTRAWYRWDESLLPTLDRWRHVLIDMRLDLTHQSNRLTLDRWATDLQLALGRPAHALHKVTSLRLLDIAQWSVIQWLGVLASRTHGGNDSLHRAMRPT